MKYSDLSVTYKADRMKDMLRHLDSGKALAINGLYLEEIKILKALYGKELAKDKGIIYRKMEMEALFL